MCKRIDLKRVVAAGLLGLVSVVLGCGGGGGNSGTSGQTIVVGSSNLSLSIANPSLAQSGTTTATATFTKADGSPASGVSATFATTLGTLTPSNGVVTTDVNGIATATLLAGTASGQGQLTTSATVEGKQVTSTALFSVNLPALHLANLRFTNNPSASINFGSSQGISVEVLDASNNLYTAQPVDVVFNSPFTTQGKSTLSSPVPTVAGVASTTYTALTAAGSDTITASISGSSVSIALTVVPLNAGSLSFVSASPTTIGLKGMGGVGIQETSRLTFKVLDTSGAAKSNQPVNFALNTTVGGLALSASSGSTGADGTVSVIVQSGVVATPVRVTASTTVGSTTLSTQSDQLVVSTGVPAQDGFSLSVANMNPEAYNHDGVTTTVTARLSDHFHNPVPDGTAVSFTTSGGMIEPSCLTVKGSCSVVWTSQNPRPLFTTGALRNGRAVVFAHAVGEEAFVDLNGNGVADAGEFTDTSEAFMDDNESGTRQANEPFLDFNGDGAFNAPDGQYNGILQGAAYVGKGRSKDVFGNLVIVMSTGEAKITAAPASLAGPGSFNVTVTDDNGNTMPSGTTITVVAPFGNLTGLTNYKVIQNVGAGIALSYSLAATDSPVAKSGSISVTVTSPSGIPSSLLIPVSGLF